MERKIENYKITILILIAIIIGESWAIYDVIKNPEKIGLQHKEELIYEQLRKN